MLPSPVPVELVEFSALPEPVPEELGRVLGACRRRCPKRWCRSRCCRSRRRWSWSSSRCCRNRRRWSWSSSRCCRSRRRWSWSSSRCCRSRRRWSWSSSRCCRSRSRRAVESRSRCRRCRGPVEVDASPAAPEPVAAVPSPSPHRRAALDGWAAARGAGAATGATATHATGPTGQARTCRAERPSTCARRARRRRARSVVRRSPCAPSPGMTTTDDADTVVADAECGDPDIDRRRRRYAATPATGGSGRHRDRGAHADGTGGCRDRRAGGTRRRTATRQTRPADDTDCDNSAVDATDEHRAGARHHRVQRSRQRRRQPSSATTSRARSWSSPTTVSPTSS